MPIKNGIKGLYEKRGWMYYQPPTPKDHSARPKAIALKTRDLREAIGRAEEHRRGLRVQRARISGTLAEVLPKYYAAKSGDSGKTVRNRTAAMNAFMKDTGNPRVADLTEELIEGWRKGLSARTSRTNEKHGKSKATALSETTIKCYTIMVKAFCNWLVEQKMLETNPAAKLSRTLRVNATRRHKFLTEDERELLLACQMPDFVRLVLMLGFFTGMREGEMLAMTPDWIWISPDGTRGSITVQQTPCQTTDGKPWVWRSKTRQKRTIPMHPRLVEFIGEYGLRRPWMIAPHKVQWPDETGNSKRFNARCGLAAVGREAGVAGLNFHILRHSFATHLAMKAIPLAEIAGLLGDTLSVTERHYAGFSPNKINPVAVL